MDVWQPLLASVIYWKNVNWQAKIPSEHSGDCSTSVPCALVDRPSIITSLAKFRLEARFWHKWVKALWFESCQGTVERCLLPSRNGSRASTGAKCGDAWVMMRSTRLGLKRGRVYRARATTPPMEWPTSTTLWGGVFRCCQSEERRGEEIKTGTYIWMCLRTYVHTYVNTYIHIISTCMYTSLLKMHKAENFFKRAVSKIRAWEI